MCLCAGILWTEERIAARGGSAALHVLSSGNGSFTPKMHSNENGSGQGGVDGGKGSMSDFVSVNYGK